MLGKLFATAAVVIGLGASVPAHAGIIDRARAEFAARLLDYQSTRVSHAYMIAWDDGPRVNALTCILANTKNRMGGYVGYHWFIVTEDKDGVFASEGGTAERICSDIAGRVAKVSGIDDYAADIAPDHIKSE